MRSRWVMNNEVAQVRDVGADVGASRRFGYLVGASQAAEPILLGNLEITLAEAWEIDKKQQPAQAA